MGIKKLITPLLEPHSGQSFNQIISISAFGHPVSIQVTSRRELQAVMNRINMIQAA